MSSAIEWTDEVWNPVTGCDRVSPGCAHCYALELAPRLRAMHRARGGGKWADAPDGARASSGPAFAVVLHPDVLEEPLRWRKPRRVFVNSMSDLFHEEVPDEYIARVFAAMATAPAHTFQILTKRPERMREWVSRVKACEHGWFTHNGENPTSYGGTGIIIPNDPRLDDPGWPLRNVWLGVSIENRRYVERADVLRATPAAVRFISAEPLLGPLVPHIHLPGRKAGWNVHGRGEVSTEPGLDLKGIDWLIVGGESGARARPMHEQWVEDLRIDARSHGTAFFFKQWGGRTPKAGGRELGGRTYDEIPKAAAA